MRINTLIIVLLLITIVHGLSRNIRDLKKGPVVMDGNILPEVINCKIPISAVLNTDNNNEFYIITMAGTVLQASLLIDIIKTLNIDSVRFEQPCREYYQNVSKTLLFGFGTRDFHVVDLIEKKSNQINLSFQGNDRIITANMINEEKRQILICVGHTGWTPEESFWYPLVYDFNENKIISNGEKFHGGLYYYLNDNNMLFQQWDFYPKPTKWWVTEDNNKKLISNKLTKVLTDKIIQNPEHTVDIPNKKMIGYFYGSDGTEVFCNIRWKENFENPKITPFTFQEPKDRYLRSKFEFSPNGKWVKAISEGGVGDDVTWILFYHSDDKYPGGLSLPVHGGESHPDAKGVFITTQEHGTVYLDITQGMDGLIYMYKMNDVRDQIIERAKEMVE